MSTLIFATNNNHKVTEIRAVLPASLQIITLAEAGINVDIPEPHPTIIENAVEKVNFIHQLTGKNSFAEDTGLEIEILNGEPGVKSARYAGDEKNPLKNIELVLNKMGNAINRKARFKTVIALMLNNKLYTFDGICNGQIITETKGDEGFGYDPIFIPDGSSKTFAQMDLLQKNIYSHRRKATDNLVEFLQQQFK